MKIALLCLLGLGLISGCGGKDHDSPCEEVGSDGGCYSTYPYTCPGADNCYVTHKDCRLSSECD